MPINNALLQLVGGSKNTSTAPLHGVNASASPSTSSGTQQPPYEPLSESVRNLNPNDLKCYSAAKKNIEELALYLKPFSCGTAASLLSRPMQRKLVTLVNCQLVEDEGRSRAIRAARSLGERTVTELILQHQNPQQLSANLWAAVRARGCQFLGPAMQEEVLKLVLLALEDGSALSRKVLVMFVVQRLEPHFPQASKTSIGHVVQLLYRASCFKVSKRESDSSLMQLKEEFRTYEALRREHDAQIVQIATEAGLRIAPDQWSALLYGDTGHKSHMQSIIDKLQTPQSFAQSVQELVIALQRTNDPSNLAGLRTYLKQLTSIDPTMENNTPTWTELAESLDAVKQVVTGLVDFVQQHGNRKLQDSSHNNHPTKYKISMCRDLAMRANCPRGSNCTFAHSEEELEKYRTRNRKLNARTPTSNISTSIQISNNKDSVLLASSMCDESSPLKEKTGQLSMQSNVQAQYDQIKPSKFQPINPCPITKTIQPQCVNYNVHLDTKHSQNIGQHNMSLLTSGLQPPSHNFQNISKTPTHQNNKYNQDQMYNNQTYIGNNTPSPHLLSPRNSNPSKIKQFKYLQEQSSSRNMGQPLRHVNDPNHPNMAWNQHPRQVLGAPHQANMSKNFLTNPQPASLPNSPNSYGGQHRAPSAMQVLQSLELRKQEILKRLERFNPNHTSNLFNNKMNNNNYINSPAGGNNQIHNNNHGGKNTHSHVNTFKEDSMNNYWNHAIPSNVNPGHPQATCVEPLTMGEQPTATQIKDDFFVRSDSILTDDDYIPFDAPTQSKYGPISRMPTKPSHPPYPQSLQHFENQFPNNDSLHFTTTTPSTTANTNALLNNANPDLSMWLYGNIQKPETGSMALYQQISKEPGDLFLDASATLTDTASSSSLSTISNNSNVDNKYPYRPAVNAPTEAKQNGLTRDLNMFEATPGDAEQNVLTRELKLIEQKLMDNNNIGNLNKVILLLFIVRYYQVIYKNRETLLLLKDLLASFQGEDRSRK